LQPYSSGTALERCSRPRPRVDVSEAGRCVRRAVCTCTPRVATRGNDTGHTWIKLVRKSVHAEGRGLQTRVSRSMYAAVIYVAIDQLVVSVTRTGPPLRMYQWSFIWLRLLTLSLIHCWNVGSQNSVISTLFLLGGTPFLVVTTLPWLFLIHWRC